MHCSNGGGRPNLSPSRGFFFGLRPAPPPRFGIPVDETICDLDTKNTILHDSTDYLTNWRHIGTSIGQTASHYIPPSFLQVSQHYTSRFILNRTHSYQYLQVYSLPLIRLPVYVTAVFSLLFRSKRTQKCPNRPTPCWDIKITTNYAISSVLCDYSISQLGIKSIKHFSSSPRSSYHYPTISDHYWPLSRYLTSFTKIFIKRLQFHQEKPPVQILQDSWECWELLRIEGICRIFNNSCRFFNNSCRIFNNF